MADACCSCEEVRKIVKEEIKNIFDQRVEELKNTITTVKTKRAKRPPSKYNIFMGDCVKSGGDFKKCAIKWKEQKKKDT